MILNTKVQIKLFNMVKYQHANSCLPNGFMLKKPQYSKVNGLLIASDKTQLARIITQGLHMDSINILFKLTFSLR